MRVGKLTHATLVSAALGFGGAVVAAPAAHADCAQPYCWAAIAFSPSTRGESFVANDGANIDQDVVATCNTRWHTGDCVLVIDGQGCVALATNPRTKAFRGGKGRTEQEAESAALAQVPGGSILEHGCVG